jgi:hypothetical protein
MNGIRDISEATAPASIERLMLEAEVQSTCVKWMRARGYWARKFSSMSQRSVPDYLFSKERGPLISTIDDCHTHRFYIKFFCEFKREGCKVDKETGFMSTQAQLDEQAAMREAGWDGFECSDVDEFKRWVLAYERNA